MTKKVLDEAEFLQQLQKTYTNPEQYQMILKAFNFAKKAHEGQLRLSGEEYFTHPCHVVSILSGLGMDYTTIVAAFLHDVLEDTSITREFIQQEFGDEVLSLVDGVTKLTKVQFQSKEEAQAENLRKMLLAMAKDVRVIIIKFADRLHNMRSLSYKSEEAQKNIARETLEIYAPLAARLGIAQFKGEMEDLCMRYLYPKDYYALVDMIDSKKEERDNFVLHVKEELKEKLDALDINYEINGRSKHFYSIYRKMQRQNSSIDEVYDLIAIRIIVDSVKDCYNVLGVIHTMWTPLPGRFKDYIATPKPNQYQSLHTTVITSLGAPFEIQIRTFEMHRIAEYGIAAHWKYKDGTTDRTMDDKIRWIREIMDLHEGDLRDSKEYLNSLKTDIFNDEVFVFTPKGDVVNLPAGSTIIDFAYEIHTDVGNKCVGGKVNMKMMPLATALKTGDIVEIITNNAAKPSRDWLRFVKASATRSKIKQYFKRTMRDENIKIGQEMLIAECKHRGFSPKELMVSEWLAATTQRYSFNSAEDVFAAIGYGELKTKQIISRLVQLYKENMPKEHINSEIEKPKQLTAEKKSKCGSNILIDGESGMQIHLCHCCNPLPGDAIIGYVTRGRGINVHRADCVNVAALDAERKIRAEWADVTAGKFMVSLTIFATNSASVIAALSSLLDSNNIEICHLNATLDKDKNAKIDVNLELTSRDQLDSIKKKIGSLKNVIGVSRK